MTPNNQHLTDRYRRGVAHYRQGRFQQASDELADFPAANDLCSRVAKYYHGMAHRQLGLAALRAGQYERAETYLRLAARSVADRGNLAEYLAAIYARTGRLDKCASEMVTLHEARPNDPDVARRTAISQWQAGRRIDAYMTLNQALRHQPDESQLTLQLGIFYAAEERFTQARQIIQQAAQTDPGNAQPHYYLGLVAAAQHDAHAAAKAFQRTFELRPDDMLVAYHLAIAARAAAQSGQKIIISLPDMNSTSESDSRGRQLAQYIAAEPDFIDAFMALPESEIDTELFDVLAGAIQMALCTHPQFADLHLHCARVLSRLGRLEDAVVHAKQAVEINPNYVNALIELGRLHAALGQPQLAGETLRQAIAKGADWPDIHCLTGQIMLQCGQKDLGRRHLERALELRADYSPAKDALVTLAA